MPKPAPDHRSSPFGPAPAPDASDRHDAPYGGPIGDGFGGHGPSADGFGGPATAIPPPAQRLGAPPQLDFGEIVAGENATKSASIWNLQRTYEAYVNVSLTGSEDFTVMGKPDRLRPSHEGVDTPITIAYHPTRRADSKATLHVTAGWQTGVWPTTTIEIPVVGKAYAAGERSHAEEAAAGAAAAKREQGAAADAARTRQLDNELDRDLHKGTQDYGASTRLQVAHERASHALTLLTAEQRQGVDDASKDVDAFHRRVPRSRQSLLFQLAMFALDAATAGIAGSLAVRLGKRVSAFVPVAARAEELHGAVLWTPGREAASTPPETVALIVESFKAGFKQAGKSAREAAFHGGAAHGEGGVSSGETIDFFSGLVSAVNSSELDRANALTDFWSHLLPTLRATPDVAIATMEAMEAALLEEADNAKTTQTNESRLAWMRFLSQHALGSLDGKQAAKLGLMPGADGTPITDVRGAARPSADGGELPKIDGMLDVEFAADYYAPEQAVAIKSARVTGVNPRMVEALAHRPLRELGIVVRAHGIPAGVAAPPIVVVRDEAGNVRFTDETGAPGQPSTWLSRKGGSLSPSSERQRLGAMKLMDELLDHNVDELLPRDSVVGTDHAE